MIKVRFDPADYSWEGEETGYVGHGDSLIVEFWEKDKLESRERFEFPAPEWCQPGDVEDVLDEVLVWIGCGQ